MEAGRRCWLDAVQRKTHARSIAALDQPAPLRDTEGEFVWVIENEVVSVGSRREEVLRVETVTTVRQAIRC